MEITINLRLSADAALTSLLTQLLGGASAPVKETKGTATSVTAAATKVFKEEPKAESKVSVEELREVASSLMVKNKAALKEILVKYEAKTVAAIAEENYPAALADMKKAMK